MYRIISMLVFKSVLILLDIFRFNDRNPKAPHLSDTISLGIVGIHLVPPDLLAVEQLEPFF